MKRLGLLGLLFLLLFLVGCGQAEAPVLQEGISITQMGEGETSFLFTITGEDGTQSAYEIHTNQTTVGAALQELDLIQGNSGPYGLYVTTVAGTTVEYDKDGNYWAFYAGDSYASSAVDATAIEEGKTYGFRVE